MADETPQMQQRGVQGDWRPIPDPTTLTTDAQVRGDQAERDYVNANLDVVRERLDGIDRATELLNETVNRTPTQIQTEIAHVRELDEVKFEAIAQQFKERDIRSEREARDNKVAVDAAFAAQKDSATQTDFANAKAIEKSEAATTKTIDTLGAVIDSSVKALSDKIDDLKQRVQAIESMRAGGRQNVTDLHQGITTTTAVLSVVFAAILIAFALYAALHR